jgi:hypothetical protein
MRAGLIVLAMIAACAPEVTRAVDLRYADGRASHQTDPARIAVVETDIDAPYDVLGDLDVILRQRGAFGDLPTRELAVQVLREQAARIGAHAVVLTAFGQMGASIWSYHELRGHGRAVRFR